MTNLEIDHYSPLPLHYQIEQLLREMIKEKEYLDGKLLPGEVEIANTLNTSRNTVRQAINKLVSEGLLVRKKGVGTQVLQYQLYTRVSNWFSFTKELEARGIKVKNYSIDYQRVIAPLEVALFFRVNDKTEVFRLERLRGNDKIPFVFFVSYFNPRIGLTGEEDFTIPLYEMLEKKFQINARTSHEELKAIMPDTFIAKKLNLTRKDPVLVRRRMVYDDNHLPIEFNIGYYIGEKFTYILESERKS